MLNEASIKNALAVIHHIMIMTRFRAGTGSGQEDLKHIMRVMDDSEYLVVLMMRESDETNFFWSYVNGMGQKFPEFSGLYEKYRPE